MGGLDREYELGKLVATTPYTQEEAAAALKQAEEQVGQLREALKSTITQCVKCQSRPRDVVAMPCMHLSVRCRLGADGR